MSTCVKDYVSIKKSSKKSLFNAKIVDLAKDKYILIVPVTRTSLNFSNFSLKIG